MNTEHITNENLKIVGGYFNFDEIENAYKIAGVKKTWTDYSKGGASWDYENYYNDFGKWWESLTNEERRNIVNQM